MGNEQANGTSHHFINDSVDDENQVQKRNSVIWTKNGRVPASKQHQSKSTWHLARDVSMDLLARKTTKLNIKQGPTPSLIRRRRSTLKKFPSHPILVPGKPLPVYRVPRMPTDKEVAEIAIAYQLLCEFCGGPCIGDYARCRVCVKTYHTLCLYERGHRSDKLFLLPRLGKQDWSCPDCGDLTRLLTIEEMNYLIHVFDQIDQNKDGHIILENYLEFCSNERSTDLYNLFYSDNEESAKTHFNLMDSRQNGAVTWWDFALFYSCILIARKNKTFLTTKLSKKELVLAKNLFLKDPHLKIDHENNIIITKEHFNRVYYDLILIIKKKYGGNYIDAVLYENQPLDETVEKFSVFGWDDFVRQISIPVILNRSNYDRTNVQAQRATPPPPPPKTNVISHTNFTSTNTHANLSVSFDTPIADAFRRHEKVLQKLNQREHQEELKRKQYGSLEWSIVEDFDDQDNLEVPKLKPNARDERQTISEPWAVVKEMQQLRNQPVLVRTTRYQMLKV